MATWGDTPSGREQAIETLIDMDARGSFYRASRVLEESFPQAILQRPNLVTKAALVEQAYALAKYEVDTLEKYDAAFGGPESPLPPSCSGRLNDTPVSDITRNRILRHHAKIMAAKKRSGVSLGVAPSPNLVASLRRVYEKVDDEEGGGADSSSLKALLKSVMSHSAFSKEEESSTVAIPTTATPSSSSPTSGESTGPIETSTGGQSSASSDCPEEGISKSSASHFLESLIAHLCDEGTTKPTETPSTSSSRNNDSNLDHGLLIATLSLLTESEVREDEDRKADQKDSNPQRQPKQEEHDPTVAPALQVGAILSLLRTEEHDTSNSGGGASWSLDTDVIAYLGQAAAVYEERIEIQKARLLKRLEASNSATKAALETAPSAAPTTTTTTPAEATSSSMKLADDDDIVLPPRVATPEPGETTDTPALQNAMGTDFRREETESSGAPLTATTFSDIISSAIGDDTSANNDSVRDGNVEEANGEGDDEERTGEDGEAQDDDGAVETDDSDNDFTLDEPNVLGIDGDEDGDDDDDDDDEEEGDDDDDDDEEDNDGADENSSSSSSSDSSASAAGPGEDDHEGEEGGVEGDDEEMVLRQALALSLVDQAEASSRIDPTLAGREDAACPASERTISAPVTPGNQTPLSDTEMEGKPSNDESPLPPIPAPPTSNPYVSLLFDSSIDKDTDHVHAADSCFFDPSALLLFGAIPASHVMIHLLTYLYERIERRKILTADEAPTITRKDRSRATAIPGGMGFALFPPNLPPMRSKFSRDTENDVAISLQLMVTLLLLAVDRRDHAIDHLKRAVTQEKKAGQEDNLYLRRDDSVMGGDEGEDPAIAMALTYIDDDLSESKESLEAKGMRRKAAAAAHDAATLLESVQKRRKAWRLQVQLFSQCCLLSMKCLRKFLQYLLKKWLRERQGVAPSDFHAFLPTALISKLSICLVSFSSKTTLNYFSSNLNEGDRADLEAFVMPLKLYRESLQLWGESVPIIYPSVDAQVKVLRNLVAECSKTPTMRQNRSLETLSSMPLSDSETHFHRLHILCRRLRVSDLLDRFVSSPACYLSEDHDDLDCEAGTGSQELEKPHCASSVIEFIGSASSDLGGLKGELEYLYLSLCHRCHVRILLWDGLFACTDSEVDHPVASLSSSPGDGAARVCVSPSNKLHFDATKCSDSMAIVASQDSLNTNAEACSVNQRASKVWGTVLSSTSFSPKTGVHRWAVKLDRCERGHVFVGVATAQASMRTYVGGDKYGWGMIGTQALWHDRRKLRGDYGATFRTGSTIIVTLDTDAGTLSFSSWKDISSQNSNSLDQVVQNLSSPRRQGQLGGIVEEWGVAFEGLPLDSKLYPAVGLYQRDDKVMLLGVESGVSGDNASSSVDLTGGLCFYPRMHECNEKDGDRSLRMQSVRRFNDMLQWDGIRYVSGTLRHIMSSIEEGCDDFLRKHLLPSLASAVCLIPPNLPVLSERFALTLLPSVTKSILRLEKSMVDTSHGQRVFQNGMLEGKWVIRATGSSGSGSDSEEYIVNFYTSVDSGLPFGFQGTGVGTTGKSKNGLVAICGTVLGSSVHFVEEWTDGSNEGFNSLPGEEAASSCVITARVSLDGCKFEGTYRNVQFGTTGHIAGLLCQGDESTEPFFRLKEAPIAQAEKRKVSDHEISAGEALLGLAHSHLTMIIGEDPADDNSNEVDKSQSSLKSTNERRDHLVKLLKCLSLPAFAESSTKCNVVSLSRNVEQIKDLYFSSSQEAIEYLPTFLNSNSLHEFCDSDADGNTASFVDNLISQVREVDTTLLGNCGGLGSLASLCPSEYQRARHLLIGAFLHHCKMVVENCSVNKLESVWTRSLKLMEDGVRRSVAKDGAGSLRDKATESCRLFIEISGFLLGLDPLRNRGIDEVGEDFARIFSLVSCKYDLEFLQEEVLRSSRRAFLRLSAIRETRILLETTGKNFILAESLATAIPRLLGRGHSEASRLQIDHLRTEDGELGTHYLSNVPGAAYGLRTAIQGDVHSLFAVLAEVATRGVKALTESKEDSTSESLTSIDSMILTVVAGLTTVLRTDDIDFLVLKSQTLPLIQDVLREYRHSLRNQLYDGRSLDEAEASMSQELHKISHTEMARAVLRAVVSLTHVVFYQVWSLPDTGSPERYASSSKCLNILRDELTTLLPFLVETLSNSMLQIKHKQRTLQWELFCYQSSKGETPRTPTDSSRTKLHRVGRSGIDFLHENGMSQSTLSQSSPQKSSSNRKSVLNSNTRLGPENPIMWLGVFCHHVFSNLVHILVAATKAPTAREIIVAQPDWISILFLAIGINFDEEESEREVRLKSEQQDGLLGTHLPGRYRCRILRLLRPLLEGMDPSVTIVQRLFGIAGSSCAAVTTSLDSDEGMVSREAVSLLRHLHSLGRSLWRAAINAAIQATVDHIQTDGNSVEKLGVLCFFNGAFDSMRRGSYVLLKPAAASALSPEHQGNPNGKSQSIAGASTASSGVPATPHHVIGNGTESVVAGLCRFEASAGIVSSIDMKNGVCEVILLERRNISRELGAENVLKKETTASRKRLQASQTTLTIRAVRSGLLDVVQAQEIPIHIDQSVPVDILVPCLLNEAIAILNQSRCVPQYDEDPENEKKDRSGGITSARKLSDIRLGQLEVTFALMAFRSCITLLSDEIVVATAMKDQKMRKTLSDVLCIAYPDDLSSPQKVDLMKSAGKRFMSSYTMHEVRLVHIASLFRRIGFEAATLESTPKNVWKLRMTDLRSKDDEPQVAKSNSGESGGYTGPSADASAVTNAPATSGLDETESTTIRREIGTNRVTSQSTAGSDSNEDDEESEAAATAAADLREAAIAQMAELGLPRSWSELALGRTGGTNIEAAVHFCLERGGEMERLLAEERERERIVQRQLPGAATSRRRVNRADTSNHLLRQLMEMGFPSRWCNEALVATGNNVDDALTWILTNGERLSAEDEGMDDGGGDEEVDDEADDEDDEEDDDDEEEDDSQATEDRHSVSVWDERESDGNEAVEKKPDHAESCNEGWSGSIIPLRFISGRSIIDPKTLAISGLPTGGFSSVGTKGIMLTSGKWYYEAILETAGCLQIGWADGSFAGHCHADRGDGCGDGPSSWAFDGWRRYRWHSMATEWGCRWREGDVIGCLVDMDDHVVSFTLNGKAEEVGMGVAFSGQGFRPCGGVYACVSFNRREKLRLILGGSGSPPFKHPPPSGYRGVGEAVLDAVKERDDLVQKEALLGESCDDGTGARFLCDFSDGEHGHELMAWAHRYYGSDASVHLGSGRLKQSNTPPKNSSSLISQESMVSQCNSRRILKEWATCGISIDGGSSDYNPIDESQMAFAMMDGILRAGTKMCRESLVETMILSSLTAKKLLLHVIVASGDDFDPECILGSDENRMKSALRFWNMIEVCASLRSAGWVGEAGSMAIAAEALGLGISSNDSSHSRQSSLERNGFVTVSDLDEGVSLPAGGIAQLLSSVLFGESASTGRSLAASAEAAIGSDGGGGLLIFLQNGLQAAVYKSDEIRSVIVASVRRSVRLLSVVEYENDDSTPVSDGDGEVEMERTLSSKEKTGKSDKDSASQPDARFTSWTSGLLLSSPVAKAADDFEEIQWNLFEAWSIGLLSASLPWRMICAFTTAGILNRCPSALISVVQSTPTLGRYYSRLPGTVARRVWAERAAIPVCSRYSQAMVELLCSVSLAVDSTSLPASFLRQWKTVAVDAATPLPFPESKESDGVDWEVEDGWISSDRGWEIWTGTIERLAVDWKTPTRSAVRSLMEGGDGPPMLREGCVVMRGVDWEESKHGCDDGKDKYELQKKKRDEKKKAEEDVPQASVEIDPASDKEEIPDETELPAEEETIEVHDPDSTVLDDDAVIESVESSRKKRKKIPSPKLPVGTIVSIEPWNGIPAMGRRVRWHITGVEQIYRYGGDGGRYDLSHVEINEKATRVRKRHPLPESAEQCAARHGFGLAKRHSVLLRLKRSVKKETGNDDSVLHREGTMELPEFGAGILVDCMLMPTGSIVLKEKELLYGSKDSGWEARFGQPSYVPNTIMTLTPTTSEQTGTQADIDAKSPFRSLFQTLVGTVTHPVQNLRNREDGSEVHVTSEMRIVRARDSISDGNISSSNPLVEAPMPPPIRFDRDCHAPSLSLSRDGRTVSCVSSDGRGSAFADIGFSKGVHYWEVKLEQADIGSVFVGVAERPNANGSSSTHAYDSPPRLNRWHGWGFVNFRATYTAGAERIYGAHCHSGDTIGVLLDCDAGRISFFFDGLKYGEHILNDLGCAFENLSPFGFNVDGCGSGGAGQGAPSGIEGGRTGRYPAQGSVRPRALYPVVGLRSHGDRVTISPKWSSSYGVDGVSTLRNILAINEVLHHYVKVSKESVTAASNLQNLPGWFMKEAFAEYQRWISNAWCRSSTRGSATYHLTSFGLDADLDASPLACASACALLGLKYALLPGDRVRLKRSAGRILELAEEAVVLGAFQGRLYYRIVSQKSEGGSLSEGGGRSWFWDESEVVDGLEPICTPKGLSIELPAMDRYRCTSSGGLKVVYEGGAVIRSDLEIFDGSFNLGTIPLDAVIAKSDVLERRVNSCGVVRYRVRFEALEGWISSRIRGGKEEPIVVPVHLPKDQEDNVDTIEKSFLTPGECAKEWMKRFCERIPTKEDAELFEIDSVGSFERHASEGTIRGLNIAQSDAFLARTMSKICGFCNGGNPLEAPFDEVASAVGFALASLQGQTLSGSISSSLDANQAAATAFESLGGRHVPNLKAIMARFALLRAFNRRARIALPWVSIRPCQEGAAILGGIHGHGASIDRAGRYSDRELLSQWVEVPSIASALRSVRGVLFASVKKELLQSITDVTTTPTPLAHDEYELPREIRTVRINRLRARRVMSGEEAGPKRKYSVFAQLQNETKAWGGAALRRGFVAKGHGGQKRAFKVKLIGEGVNDYSGPYREAFTDALSEILNVDKNGNGSLGVLDPTPNNVSAIGENRDLFMFSLNGSSIPGLSKAKCAFSLREKSIQSSFSSLIAARDESSREVEEGLVFLGKLTGTAFRHGIQLDLPLPMESVWKAMVEEETKGDFDDLQELDTLAYRQRSENTESHPELLWWQKRMLNSFVDGLSSVLPVEVFSILSGEELREFVCGNPEVDVDMLRRVVEYEGYEDSDPVVQYFWETLREFTNDERKSFLQFVWARNRLPVKEADFDAPFKIQKDNSIDGDQALPSASTCFFSLALPSYKTKEQLKEKLLFAINNVTTMETDFQTNSAEIAEGYRAI